MPKLTRILSIDGGGIRGLIPGQLLVAFEKKLQKESDRPDARIADYFDLIAGTSTGGILACLYLCPDTDDTDRSRFTAQDAVDLYFEHGDEIFSVPIWHAITSAGGLADEKYPADVLEQTLHTYFGDLRLSNVRNTCLITAYDIRKREAVFFTAHDARRERSRNYYVRDIARATSAAPTYFEAARIASETNIPRPVIDGGVFANNPTMCAYAEARAQMNGKPKAKDMVILSLGTGSVKRPYYYKEAKNWGKMAWIRPLIDIMMSGAAETVNYQMHRLYETTDVPEQYQRIDVDMTNMPSERTEMDNASVENMRALIDIGRKAADKHDEQLTLLAKLLVKNGAQSAGSRRSRSTRKRSPGKAGASA